MVKALMMAATAKTASQTASMMVRLMTLERGITVRN
jgi:hypothetical protein